MLLYYRNEALIVLLVAIVEMISISAAIVSSYQNKPKDSFYGMAIAGIVLGGLTLILGVLAWFNLYIDAILDAWVILIMFYNLIMVVIGIVVFPAQNGWGTFGWVMAVILTIVINGFGTNAALPLSNTSKNE